MDANMTLERMNIHLPVKTDDFTFYFGNHRKPSLLEFEKICQANPDMQIEMDMTGNVIIMPPVYSDLSEKNGEIIYQLGHWAKMDKTGKVYESSGGFVLPNGAIRSPDACWIKKARLEKLTEKERQGFINICPDFVVELRSATDSLTKLKSKMIEYIENGTQLGWLIDPGKSKIYVYRKDKTVEVLENPNTLSGEDVLRNFELDLSEIL